jgi:hypothetical protein
MPAQCDECRGKGRRNELAKLDQGGSGQRRQALIDSVLEFCGHFPRAGEVYF